MVIEKQEIVRHIRGVIQRLSFHRYYVSKIVAELRYITARTSDDRVQIALETAADFHVDSDWRTDKVTYKDLLFSRAYYAINSKEYYLFGLNRSKGIEKNSYVGWRELDHYYSLLNKMGSPEIFDRKDRTYQVFKQYYRREQEIISGPQNKDTFQAFLERHEAAIIKPLDEYGGHGVEIIHCSDEQTLDKIWERICLHCPFLVEELIIQAPEMNVFYPDAVNTIRYNTFFHEGKLTRLQAAFRIGRGGSIVDNATSGGIYTLVDTDSGRILCPARSDFGEQFEVHPDTGVRFEGNQIPRWNELNGLLDRIVRVVPKQKLVGWDFALSKDGWVLVEGNTRPALQSFDLDHGLRQFLKDSFGNAIRMWE